MSNPRLLDQVRTVIRVKHFSLSTERAYVSWIRRFILFHHKRHPKEMAEPEIRQFISHLAIDAKISASTQTVALSALLFLYRDVLKHELPYVDHIELSNLGHRPRICRPFEELLIPRRCREYHRQGSMIRKLSCRSSGGGEPPFPT